MAVIGTFQSDLSITCKTDGNFWKRFCGCFVFQSCVTTKMVVIKNHDVFISDQA